MLSKPQPFVFGISNNQQVTSVAAPDFSDHSLSLSKMTPYLGTKRAKSSIQEHGLASLSNESKRGAFGTRNRAASSKSSSSVPEVLEVTVVMLDVSSDRVPFATKANTNFIGRLMSQGRGDVIDLSSISTPEIFKTKLLGLSLVSEFATLGFMLASFDTDGNILNEFVYYVDLQTEKWRLPSFSQLKLLIKAQSGVLFLKPFVPEEQDVSYHFILFLYAFNFIYTFIL